MYIPALCLADSGSISHVVWPGTGQGRPGELFRPLVRPLPTLQAALPRAGQKAVACPEPCGLSESWHRMFFEPELLKIVVCLVLWREDGFISCFDFRSCDIICQPHALIPSVFGMIVISRRNVTAICRFGLFIFWYPQPSPKLSSWRIYTDWWHGDSEWTNVRPHSWSL